MERTTAKPPALLFGLQANNVAQAVARKRFLHWLHSNPLGVLPRIPLDDRCDLERAVAEAVENAALHGLKYCGRPLIRVRLFACERGIEVTVQDFGVGFDPAACLQPEGPLNPLDEHGRGYFLMRQVCRVDYVFPSDGSTVCRLSYRFRD